VDPSPPTSQSSAQTKAQLRKHYRTLRRAHVEAQPQGLRALLFLRPPAPVVRMLPDGATVGLYHAGPHEAPTLPYARWLHENGHALALPFFAARDAAMEFRTWSDPYHEDELEAGPYGMLQPRADAAAVEPSVVFVPLLAFEPDGTRLGQGGGHYDRWLGAQSDTLAIGLGWDCQLAQDLPREDHDQRLAAVITPTRFYEGHP
jgi:5-formyltetrahydrofolate cyclo-ligase